MDSIMWLLIILQLMIAIFAFVVDVVLFSIIVCALFDWHPVEWWRSRQ